MESEKVYNSGKKTGGAAMKKISKWDYIYLFAGIIGVLLPFSLFFIEVGTTTTIRVSIIAPIIGLGMLSRFFTAYKKAKENDSETRND